MARLKSGKVSVLIVPEKEGAVFSFKLPVLIFRIVVIAGVLGAIFVIIMFFSWTRLLRKASTYDRLAEENATLLQEHDRIVDLQARVERLQELEDQIRRVLGAKSPADSLRRFASPLVSATQEPETAAAEMPPSPLQSAVSGVRQAIFSLTEPGILKEPEIPSLWPVQGYRTRGFESDELMPERGHRGIDVAAREGTVIKATAGGVVIWSGWSSLYGNVVILAHSADYFSFYGHNQTNLVRAHQRVERGDPLALLGNTGQSTAPHLHFEIWRNGEPLDPLNVLMPY